MAVSYHRDNLLLEHTPPSLKNKRYIFHVDSLDVDMEKKTVPTEEIREVPPSLNDAELASSNEDWQPGFWRHFPWLGFFSIIVIILCTLGSVIVLVLSDDVSDRHWQPRKLPPSVWLSGFNNISNIFFGVAIGKKRYALCY